MRTLSQLNDRDWLYQRYVIKQHSAKRLAEELGCGRSTVLRALRDHDLSPRHRGRQAGRPWNGRARACKRCRRTFSPRSSAQVFCDECPGRVVNSEGYVVVYVGGRDVSAVAKAMAAARGGSVPEHRLVMAEFLGRVLRPDETVHHINGDRQDNRIENLQLRSGRHGAGVALVCHDCGSANVGPAEL